MRRGARSVAALGLAVVAAAFGHGRAGADEMDVIAALDAPVDFTADYSLTADDQTWRGTIEHAPGRERREFATVLGSQAILLRRDIDQAAVLWPKRKWYLTTSLSKLARIVGGPAGITLDRRRDGSEFVSGERCSRWLVDGGFAGRIWLSTDGILMRAAGILKLRGRETTVATQLAHVKRNAVDADEFELPLGYHGIPVSPSLLGQVD